MINFGKGVVKLRIPILIVSIILLFPAALGYFHTRVNYDILTYLPKEIDTMKGQTFFWTNLAQEHFPCA